MICEITAWHISTEHMDGHAWLVFGLLLGGPLVLLFWTGLRVRRDAPEASDIVGLGLTPEGYGSDELHGPVPPVP